MNRLILHASRFRGYTVQMILTSVIATLIFSLFFPVMGEDAVRTMFGVIIDSPYIQSIPGVGEGTTEWTLWLIFYLRLLLFYIFALAGISLGARIMPTTTDDGVEILVGSNPVPVRRYYLENVVTSSILLAIIIMPMYLLILGATAIYGSTDLYANISQVFLSTYAVGLFHMAGVSLLSVLMFSRFKARVLGYVYLAASFVFEAIADNPDYLDIGKLSVNFYVQPMGPIVPGYDWTEVWQILLLSLVFIAVAWWSVKRHGFIEKVVDTSSKRKFRNPLTGIISGFVSPDSSLGKRFPLFIDQIRADAGFFVGVLAFISFQQLALYNALPSVDTLAEALAASDSPVLSAFSQNHPLEQSLLGFVVLKFYSSMWLFFGVFTLFVAASIPNRDVRNNTHDILFANNVPPKRLVISRIAGMVLSQTLLIWLTFALIRVFQNGKLELDLWLQASVFLVAWIHYVGFGILLAGIAMIPTVSKGRSVAIYSFTYFVVFSLIPFLDSSIEFLRYFSYLTYYDPVGMIYGITPFLPQFLTSLALLVLSVGFVWIVIERRYKLTDLR